MQTMYLPDTHTVETGLKTNSRYWELALGCRIDADSVREIQGCTLK